MNMPHRNRHAGVALACLTFIFIPLSMGPGCLPGTTPLPFTTFEYSVHGVFGEAPLGVQSAKITKLDNGWYQLEMTLREAGGLFAPLCLDPENPNPLCVQIRALPSRYLSDDELARINEVFSIVETATYENPGFCADPISATTYRWDDVEYHSDTGLCAPGEYTKLSNESRQAIDELVDSLR
ncbi:MAG TPA: hypothetical protein P5081_10750 [Phycisphaerae bacterium]|nr:hypothetical protein [Phycisphaerae bacterium]HRW53357.1 hypothetical protein [Phycisphaerae bacterium]